MMETVGYCNPFVPPEWISAHGFRPVWLQPHVGALRREMGLGRATCPYVMGIVDELLGDSQVRAAVLTTTCDPMRYASAVVSSRASQPVFLLNVPSTWQTEVVSQLYADELQRLGRCLAQLRGREPDQEDVARAMLEYDARRSAVRAARTRLSAVKFSRALRAVREDSLPDLEGDTEPRGTGPRSLALVGGPLAEDDEPLLDLVERSGGRIVLNATETGERTLPASFDRERLRQDSLGELTRAYFGTIPDVFRRPNHGFYEWLGAEINARNVRGIIYRRYVWCDLWHAELARLREWCDLPLLEIDVGENGGAWTGTVNRIEAFLESLV